MDGEPNSKYACTKIVRCETCGFRRTIPLGLRLKACIQCDGGAFEVAAIRLPLVSTVVSSQPPIDVAGMLMTAIGHFATARDSHIWPAVTGLIVSSAIAARFDLDTEALERIDPVVIAEDHALAVFGVKIGVDSELNEDECVLEFVQGHIHRMTLTTRNTDWATG